MIGLGMAGMGLGMGIGRRGLQGIPSKREEDGATSPKSTHSTESSRTVGSRFMGMSLPRPWSDERLDQQEQEHRAELMEKVAEVEVEREMIKEVEEEKKDRKEEKMIRKAQVEGMGSAMRKGSASRVRVGSGAGQMRRVKRIVLREYTVGKVVQMRVLEGSLMILRNTG